MKFSYSMLFLISMIFSEAALAELLITPTRVTFEPKERAKHVTLVNTGDETRTYKLQWIEQKQTETQGYKVLSGADADKFLTASEHIRFSPRRVRLAPGESQRIKLLVRRSPDMSAAEYRSHLKFTALPPDKKEPEVPEEDIEGYVFKIDTLTSYSIPIVLNLQDLPYQIEFSSLDFSLSQGRNYPAKLNFTLSKQVPRSVFGNMTMLFKPDGSDEFVPVGYLNGVNVFHETSELRQHLAWTEDVPISSGRLRLEYKGIREFAGKFEISKEINI